MLRIQDVEIPTGVQYGNGVSHDFPQIGSIKGYVFRDWKVSTLRAWRSRYDFLDQGTSFDRFHNKSVANRQFDGIIIPSIEVNGEVSYAGSTKTSECQYYSPAPSARLDRRYYYAFLQVKPVEVGGTLYSGGRFVVQMYRASAIGVPGKQVACSTSTNITIDKDGLVGVSGSWYCPSIGSPSSGRGYVHIDAYLASLVHRKYTSKDECAELLPSMLTANQWLETECELAYYRFLNSNPEGPQMRRVDNSFRSVNVAPVDRDQVEEYIKYFLPLCSHLEFTSAQRSSHARELIESLNSFDSNLLAYGSDLRKTGDTLREILKLPKNIKSPKAWASAWLSGRYGDRLAISDTKELLKSIERQLTTRKAYALARKRLNAQENTEHYTKFTSQTSTIVAADDSWNGVMTAVHNLMKWDVWPTLENTWDMIPLSFVVDWALPVSDILGQIDAAVEAPYIKPITEYRGTKTVTRFDLSSFSSVLAGSITCKYYTRERASILSDVKPFEADINFLPSFSVINIGDALALTTTLRHR